MTITKSLKALKRDGSGKGVARKLRQAGRVPAVLYGKDMDPVHLSVEAMEAGHLFAAISVENTIIELEVEGEKSSVQTLVREVQSHPHKKELFHVDFYRLQKDVAVEVSVPVELDGTPVGVKTHGGNLEHVLHELPVVCIPSLIPEVIRVDVSRLDLDQAIHVADIVLPEGVESAVEGDRLVCMVVVPRGGETEVGEEPSTAAPEPEVIGHDKGAQD